MGPKGPNIEQVGPLKGPRAPRSVLGKYQSQRPQQPRVELPQNPKTPQMQKLINKKINFIDANKLIVTYLIIFVVRKIFCEKRIRKSILVRIDTVLSIRGVRTRK